MRYRLRAANAELLRRAVALQRLVAGAYVPGVLAAYCQQASQFCAELETQARRNLKLLQVGAVDLSVEVFDALLDGLRQPADGLPVHGRGADLVIAGHRSRLARWRCRAGGGTGCGLGQADRGEEAVVFAVDPGGEVEGVGARAPGPVAEGHPPDANVSDRVAGRVGELAQELPGLQVEGVDPAVAEVAHQQRVAEGAEVGGSAP